MKRYERMLVAMLLPCLMLGLGRPVRAQMVTGTGNEIGVTQRLGQQVPLDLRLRDETGQSVTLRQYTGRKPVMLMMVFYRCAGLCAREFAGLVGTLTKWKSTIGDDFDIVTVSIDPTETPALAAAKKKEVLGEYRRPQAASAWHFLVADKPTLQTLSAAVGFKYTYDPSTGRIAHPAVGIVMTADGRISRYIFGVDYPTRILKDAFADARTSRIASPDTDPVLLGCLTYNEKTGKYHLVVDRALKVGGIGTASILALSILFMSVKYRGGSRQDAAAPRNSNVGETGDV